MQIAKTYQLPFPVERVFAAWVSSETVIPPSTRMDIRPVVGGHYRLFIETPDSVMSNDGKFLEIVENERIRYTWSWSGDDEVTEITVSFRPASTGTQIHLFHEGFTCEQSRAMHDTGWDDYIEGLTAHIAARPN